MLLRGTMMMKKKKIRFSRLIRIFFTCYLCCIIGGIFIFLAISLFEYIMLGKINNFKYTFFMYLKLGTLGGVISGIGCCFDKEWK